MSDAGYAHMYSLSDKAAIANRADALVNLLPETRHTCHVMDTAFFSAMKPNSLLINAGRGSALDQGALLQGLANNKPALAILDVFEQEPLAKESDLWSHPNVMITHHTAAISSPRHVAQCFIKNAERYLNNFPLLHQVDFDKGY